ncbi:MAG: hypothetical protein WC486_00360 [Candidatus Omnitrophota bacterium]
MRTFLVMFIVILMAGNYADGLAYFEEYPPYEFKNGPPKHLEAETLVDHGSKHDYKSEDGSVVARLMATDISLDFLVREGGYVLTRKNVQELPFPVGAVYWADLEGNGLKDFIIFYWWQAPGIMFPLCRVEIFLKKETGGYRKIYYDTLSPGLEDFADLDNDGKYEVIITDIYERGRHNYYSYSIYEFKGYELVNADNKFRGFPKFVWYTHNPNDKDTGHLTRQERLLHTKEKDAMIWYENITKTGMPYRD